MKSNQIRSLQIKLKLSQQSTNDAKIDICRICLQNEQVNYLVTPCKCNGSVRCVHPRCAIQWSTKQKLLQDQEQGYYLNCQICKDKIYFQVKVVKEWKNWEQIKQVFALNQKYTIVILIICIIILISFFSSMGFTADAFALRNQAKGFALLGLTLFFLGLLSALVIFCIFKLLVNQTLVVNRLILPYQRESQDNYSKIGITAQ